jgi:hypothetical protein
MLFFVHRFNLQRKIGPPLDDCPREVHPPHVPHVLTVGIFHLPTEWKLQAQNCVFYETATTSPIFCESNRCVFHLHPTLINVLKILKKDRSLVLE